MKKKMLAVVVAGAMLFSTVPVFGAEEEMLEFSVTPVEESISEDISEEEPLDALVEEAEEVVSENTLAEEYTLTPHERYESEETDTTIVEKLDLPELGFVSADEITADGASSSSFVYYSQYAWQCKAEYDVIEVLIKGEDGKYASRMFFVYDRLYKEWLRYDYTKMAAETFLMKWETKTSSSGTLYVPVEKTSGEKKVLHSDNPETAVDESKIPTIADKDVTGIDYAWKGLSEIPFIKNGGTFEYAGEGKEEDPKPDPKPTPEPVPGEDVSDSTEINGHKYTVIWTGTLSYNGMAHVWDQTKVSAKNAKKQVADLKVEIIRDGALVDPSNYSVTCKNNINVTGYNGKNQPYFKIVLKGTYKNDNVKMAKAKLPFNITPCSVEQGKFQAKKVVTQGNKTSFTNLYFVFSDGRKVKLGAYNPKKGTGTYSSVTLEDGSIQLTGYNNLSGTGILSLENPRKITYEF